MSQWCTIVPHLAFAALIRVALVLYGILHDRLFQLKYTDVDYIVFTDGAKYIVEGRSPFLRYGYRYSPVLAMCMVPNVLAMKIFGKLIFVAFDLITGYLIYKILCLIRTPRVTESDGVTAAIIWLYNPLTFIISTRGSSDSMMTALVLLILFYLAKDKCLLAGITYGFAVHFKLYPIIYSPAIYWYLRDYQTPTKDTFNLSTVNPFTGKRVTFFISSLITFTCTTYLCYHFYGNKYINEAWLYHFSRIDSQHNFSIYFYLFQLASGTSIVSLISSAATLVQVVSILYCLKYVIWPASVSPFVQDSHLFSLLFSTFMSTYLFVSLNKVITSQYFIWYFSLVPLIIPVTYHAIPYSKYMKMLIIWLLAQVIWLVPAYVYEFLHVKGALIYVWMASIVFCCVNLTLARIVCEAYTASRKYLHHQQVKSE